MFDTLHKMKHSSNTVFGTFDITYVGDTLDNPVHGICQGNGAGPAAWVTIINRCSYETGIWYMFQEP